VFGCHFLGEVCLAEEFCYDEQCYPGIFFFFLPDTVSACDKCPFTSDSATVMGAHKEQHLSRPGAIFKCYFCPFYVSLKRFVIFIYIYIYVICRSVYVRVWCKEKNKGILFCLEEMLEAVKIIAYVNSVNNCPKLDPA